MSNKKKLEIKVIKATITRITEQRQDPYAILTIGAEKHQTTVQEDKATNPQWNETFVFQQVTEESLKVEIFDFDTAEKSDIIGTGNFLLKKVSENPLDVTIEIMFEGKKAADLFLELKYLVEKKIEKEDPKKQQQQQSQVKKQQQPENNEFFDKMNTRFDQIKKQHFDIKFLFNDYFTDATTKKIIVSGLVQMYKHQPSNPIKFLGQHLIDNANQYQSHKK